MLGDPRELRSAELADRVVQVLRAVGDWQKTGEVVAGLSGPRPSQEAVRKVLLPLAGRGVVEHDPSGRAHRWRIRPPIIETSPPTDNP